MSNVDIKVPSVGESITEATVGRWNYSTGDWVEKDAAVFELETEKATVEVTSPASGLLTITKEQGQTVPIGAVVGSVDTSVSKPAGAGAAKTKEKPKASTTPPPAPAVSATPHSPTSTGPVISEERMKGLGPSTRKAVREGKIPLPTAGGPAVSQKTLAEGETRHPMSTIRKKIAERLLHSQQSTATLTTFNEIDMSNLMGLRAKLQEEFTKKFGVKLGFMSFFTRAVAYGISQVPNVNARIDGTDIVGNRHLHAGIAVSTEKGLIVPVLKFADRLSFADIEKNVADLAERARTGQIGIDEMTGGTFTITNGGVFGSLLSTPILNPPQSGILGMHKIEQRPMAVDEGNGKYSVQVRPMMYVALSYDHRLIDGRESVTFLVKVKEFLETVKAEEILGRA